MQTPFLRETTLRATPWCVVREQENQYLVYNSRTDELHLLSPTAFYVYRRCSGWSTLGQIEEDLRDALPQEAAALPAALDAFVEMLLARGIVEKLP